MDLEIFATPGLGDASFVLAGGGEAVLVDPQRDAWRFLDAAARRGWRVTHVVETHVHNDYLSGALEIRAATGAEIVAPARGRYEFPHRGVDEGDRVELAEFALEAMATPGHTPEHLAWAVRTEAAGEHPEAVFTGGSLLAGTAGRTDLLGADREPALTADQQASLRRLAELPDSVIVLPTHGSGSFCGAGPTTSVVMTTMAEQRAENAVLRAAAGDPAEFRARVLGSLGRFPDYYAHIAPINRRGPPVLGRPPTSAPLDPIRFEAAVRGGLPVVDARDREAFAAAHLPGALNIELDDAFASYVGWLVPFETAVLLVLPEPEAETAAVATTALLRIGYEVLGHLAGGVEAWERSGRSTATYGTASIRDVDPSTTTTLDVRQPIEWRDEGMVPGSTGIFVADLPARLDELPRDRPVTVFCKSGSRAAIAASVLDAAGFDVRLVSHGGATRWPGELQRGPEVAQPGEPAGEP